MQMYEGLSHYELIRSPLVAFLSILIFCANAVGQPWGIFGRISCNIAFDFELINQLHSSSKKTKTSTMLLTGPETVDALAMIGRAVPLVTRESVIWVDSVHVDHDLIAADLGDDRGGADRSICRIPTDDRLAIDTFTAKRQFRESVAIDLNIIWSNRQAKKGTSHCEKRRLENIQAIDFGRIRPGNRPRQRMLSNLTGNFRSALRSQFLGVSKAVDRRVTVEDDGTGDDRSR